MTKTIQQFKDEMFKDNRINTNKYYLLYIDILGMKSLIDSKESELYLNYINNVYRDAIKGITGIYEEINKIKIDVRIFSDNLVVAIKEDDDKLSSLEAIKRTLIVEIASFIQMLALKYSLLVRGSITYGDFYIDENFLYGKALTRAYALESEVAIYPRIILDDNIASICNAILYGRTIFKSIRKFIIYQVTVNMCALILSIIGPFIGIDTPITIIQMLWLNMKIPLQPV